MTMRPLIVCFGLAALLLSGCSLFQRDDPRVCPRVSILNEAARVAVYRDGPGRDLIDVVHEGQIADVRWSCVYSAERVRVLVTISILAQRGPAATKPEAEFDYFVAVTRAADEILGKEIFRSQVAFPEGRTQTGVFEEIEQIIPLPDQNAGPDYEVVVGFQLTEDQLRHNRKRRRF